MAFLPPRVLNQLDVASGGLPGNRYSQGSKPDEISLIQISRSDSGPFLIRPCPLRVVHLYQQY
jgi:hypothetical protein